MNILCLDLGQSCGVAGLYDGKIHSEVWNFKASKYDSAGVKFLKFQRHLEAEIVLNEVKKVFYEAVRRHIGTDAAHAYGGYMGILQSTCLALDVPYEGVPVGTIKKHATGSGNADKGQMISAAVLKFKGVNLTTDDEADALWLLDYARTLNCKM